jgi:hypothetical protein
MTNAIARPAEAAAANNAPNRTRSTMLTGRVLRLARARGLVVRDDGAGYGKAQRRGKTNAILTLRQRRHR